MQPLLEIFPSRERSQAKQMFTQRFSVPDNQGTFREHVKEKYLLKNYLRKLF